VRLRSRLVQEALALAGITVGVALVFAALVANTSLTGSIRQLTEGIVGAADLQLSARGQQGMDERLLARVERIDGVRNAVPLVDAWVNVEGPDGERSLLLVGGEARFARLDGTLLPNFAEAELGRQKTVGLPQPVATDLGLSLGESLVLETGSRRHEIPLGAQLQSTDVGTLIDSPVALASLSSAQRLAGLEGRLTRVFVEAEPGSEKAVEEGLRDLANGRLNVGPASGEVDVFERAAFPTNQSIALFSVFSALVGFLFAFSAVLLTVPQRRRLIADLRMAGHPPWVLVQILLFDALVLGLAGAGLGLLLGDQVSRHLFDSTPDYLSAAFAVGSQRVVSWQAVAVAAGTGLLAAGLAVMVPLRDILSRYVAVPSAQARRNGDRWAAGLGCVCLAATAAALIEAPAAAFFSIFVLTVALLCVLPLTLCIVAGACGAAAGSLRSPVPVLAILELRSRATHLRTLAVVATGAVAVFATVAIGGAHADLERGLQQSAREIDGNADVWVTFDGSGNTLATSYLGHPRAYADLQDVPGVRAVLPYRGSFLDIGDLRAWVLAPAPQSVRSVPPSQVRDGDAQVAAERVEGGGWVAVSEAVAEKQGVGVGDRVTLPSPVPTPLRVAAVTNNLAWPSGAVVLNADDYARAWGTERVSGLQIEAERDHSEAEVAAAVRRKLGPDTPLRVETSQQRVERHYGTARDALSRLTQISILVIISAVLAMAAAMGGMIWQRRDTLAALKVHGYPESELWRALLLESVLLLGTGCVVGGLFGLYGQMLMSRALATITGFPIVYGAAGTTALTILVLVTAVSVAMLAIPGWLAVRVRAAPGATR
jgi:putative ABC transport system permease protein